MSDFESIESEPLRTATNPRFRPNRRRRALIDPLFRGLCLVAACVSVSFLALIPAAILWAALFPAANTSQAVSPITPAAGADGSSGRLDSGERSTDASKSSYRAGLAGTAWLALFVVLTAVPAGVGTGVYLEEYRVGRSKSSLGSNIASLAGVPSIVYGLAGLAIFQRLSAYPGMAPSSLRLAWGLTLALLIMPMIVIATCESLRAVPQSLRMAALALGATRWQMIRGHLLPAAAPGILTGSIQGVARAIGETAPLLMIAAAASRTSESGSLFEARTVVPLEIYYNIGEPGEAGASAAAGGLLILLFLVLAMNSGAIWIRHRTGRRDDASAARREVSPR